MLKAARWSVIGLLAVSILVLAFAFGYVARGDGASPEATAALPTPGSNGSATTADTDFKNLNDIFKLLQSKYVDPDIIDRETLYQAAINGMLQTFPDSGTFYVDPNTVQTSVGPSGKFEGIGATVASQNGQIVIVSPDRGHARRTRGHQGRRRHPGGRRRIDRGLVAREGRAEDPRRERHDGNAQDRSATHEELTVDDRARRDQGPERDHAAARRRAEGRRRQQHRRSRLHPHSRVRRADEGTRCRRP